MTLAVIVISTWNPLLVPVILVMTGFSGAVAVVLVVFFIRVLWELLSA